MFFSLNENDQQYEIMQSTIANLENINHQLDKYMFYHFHFESVVDLRQKSPFIALIIACGSGNTLSSCDSITLIFLNYEHKYVKTLNIYPGNGV